MLNAALRKIKIDLNKIINIIQVNFRKVYPWCEYG